MIVILNSDVFGKNVMFYRAIRNISLEETAKKCGIEPYELEEIESGSMREMDENDMIKISQALDVPLKELLGE